MEEKNYKIGKLAYLTDDPSDLKKMDASCVVPQNKSVLIFTGNQTNHMVDAGRYALYVKFWLDNQNNNKNIDILAVSYPFSNIVLADGSVNTQYDYSEYARDLLLPYFAKDGKRLSYAEALANVSNLTVFGHSAGCMVFDFCLSELLPQLENIGYKKEEIDKLYSNIAFVGYAPYKMVNHPIKAMYIAPMFDSVGSFVKSFEYLSTKQHIDNNAAFSINKFFEIYNTDKQQAQAYCRTKLNKYGAICATDHTSTLVIAPDLLFRSSNIPEDHNLAGIIKYPFPYPNKTSVGEKTTEIMSTFLRSACLFSRSNFSVEFLYKYSTKKYQSENQTEMEK